EPLERRIHDDTAKSLEDALGAGAFAELHAAGRGMSLGDACAYALGGREPSPEAAELGSV
ncbi:MAG TPA: hypothetical protein VD704_13380, partial [Gaiellaceae bacterium]|nr:hypothetical protein [Gaiellaceae bacterium]